MRLLSDKADHGASLRVCVSDMRALVSDMRSLVSDMHALVSERTRKPSGITVSQDIFLKTLDFETLAEV